MWGHVKEILDAEKNSEHKSSKGKNWGSAKDHYSGHFVACVDTKWMPADILRVTERTLDWTSKNFRVAQGDDKKVI
jgi:hypothetical protein